MTERMIDTSGVELCTESFGDPADPPVLLIMGIGASMLWWEEGFCRMLAAGRRFVIRYDHRDTGRSVTYQHGQPEYTGAELVADAVGVLDAYGIPAAHIVGVSAQLLVLDHPDRVFSLVLISTSLATAGDRALPPPTEEFGRFVSTAHVDWSDAGSVIEYQVGYTRMLAGAAAGSMKRRLETSCVASSNAPGTSRRYKITTRSRTATEGASHSPRSARPRW
jgi:pimeloyl-ACP methyl ester carboxylesterase